MSQSMKDIIEGKLHEAKGAVTANVGKVLGNEKLTDRGNAENIAGKVQKKVGRIEKVLES